MMHSFPASSSVSLFLGKQLKVNYATALRSAAVAGSLGVGLSGQLSPIMGAPAAAAAAAGPPAAPPTPTPGTDGVTGAPSLPLGLPQPPTAATSVAAASSPTPAVPPAATTEQQQQQKGDGAAAAAAAGFPEKPSGEPGSSNVLLLTNTVAPEEVDDDLKEEVRVFKQISLSSLLTILSLSLSPHPCCCLLAVPIDST